MIPYGRHIIDNDDIKAVVDALESDFLTTGPKVKAFEDSFAQYVGMEHAVAVSSGTAALHCAMYAIGIGKGDEVIVPPMTFAATANCIVYQGGIPIFADVESDTLLIDPSDVERQITTRTKAIIGVDYAGQACDWDSLKDIAKDHNLFLIADSCHALGATYKKKMVGTLADISVFSFHPVKHITTGEGGMLVTNDEEIGSRVRLFRSHGINATSEEREKQGTWYYEMVDLGFNYRITDLQCALGMSQLKKAEKFLAKRREIAAVYDQSFVEISSLVPLSVHPHNHHAYHLYVIQVDSNRRSEIFSHLREAGIGVNVHYIPVHLHPYYREKMKTKSGLCPKAETAYERIISLPLHPNMSDNDVSRVIESVRRYA